MGRGHGHTAAGTIEELSAVCRDIPLAKPFRFASTELQSLPYAWVRVKSSSGLIGFGECPSYWDPSGETQMAAVGAIRLLMGELVGQNVADIELVHSIFDHRAYGAFAAKCGLDSALYDIIGQAHGVPVNELLGGTSQPVIVNGIIPIVSSRSDSNRNEVIEAAVNSAVEQVKSGFAFLKVKVGIDLDFERELLTQIKHAIAPSVTVFVDANQAWGTAKVAIRAIKYLEETGIEWVEQPVRANDIDGLRRVRDAVSVSIVADESLYSPVDALRLASAGAADMFNIKLAKCGGMWPGAQVLAIARAANIPCLLGSMVESSLGMLANYHFATAHKMHTCGLSVYGEVRDGLDVGLEIKEGVLHKSDKLPGLGYPDCSTLDRLFSSA